MNDKELLELAAKAAGIEIYFRADRGQMPYAELCSIEGSVIPWSPLTDDGDALRLAVDLQMAIAVFDDAVGIGRKGSSYGETDIGGDPYAATRRAIVRAAAEIGKAGK